MSFLRGTCLAMVVMADMTPHALSIPEIASAIRQYLTQDDLLASIRVSQLWHSVFIPFIWETINPSILLDSFEALHVECDQGDNREHDAREQERENESKQVDPPVMMVSDICRKHAQYIVSLTYATLLPLSFFTLDLPNLTYLDLSCPVQIDPWTVTMVEQSWDLYRTLLQRLSVCHSPMSSLPGAAFPSSSSSCSLRFLSITLTWPSPPTCFWDTLSRCQSLEHLCLKSVVFDTAEGSAAFWKACKDLSRLQTLEMDLTIVPVFRKDPDHHLRDPNLKGFFSSSLSTLREMIIFGGKGDNACQAFVDMMKDCPDLISITWQGLCLARTIFSQIRKAVQEGRWPRLNTIDFDTGMVLHDEDLAGILRSMTELVILGLPRNGGMGPLALRVLLGQDNNGLSLPYHLLCRAQPLCWSLREVYLRDDEEGSSLVVQKLLENCQNLAILYATRIRIDDIMEGKPWICGGLREWVVWIDMRSTSIAGIYEHEMDAALRAQREEQLDRVYSLLGRLKQLEVLDLIADARNPWSISLDHTLDLRVSAGLGKLEGLSKLRYLRFGGYQLMKKLEARFMLKHWDKIETILGTFHHEPGIAASVKRVLRYPGIKFADT